MGPTFSSFISCYFLPSVADWNVLTAFIAPRGGGGGALPYNKLYRYVPPQRVWFSRRFAHFVLNLGIVFEGTTGPFVIGAFEKRVPGLKMGGENDMFYGLKQGQGLKNGTPPPRISRSTPSGFKAQKNHSYRRCFFLVNNIPSVYCSITRTVPSSSLSI